MSKYDRVAERLIGSLANNDDTDLVWVTPDDVTDSREEIIKNVAAILSEEFAGYEEMKEAIHSKLDVISPKAVFDKGSVLAKNAQWVNRFHDNGDGTGTITERQEPPIERKE